MTEQRVHLKVLLRPHQLALHRARTRFSVRVVHRRFGKTFLSIVELLLGALQTHRKDHRGYYLAPTFKQAKSISWDYLKAFTADMPGVSSNESELRLDFWNGARLQLLGAEQYDSLRGLYADDLVIDETAMVPRSAWSQVLSPMLVDRLGRATFAGTPMGRMNLFFDLWQLAGGDDPEWSRALLTYADTQVIPPAEIGRMRRQMSEAEFAQELECSWNAALLGAYFAREMADADRQGRVTDVRYDAMLPVVAAVDLGWSDAMVASFWQQTGTEHRCICARGYQYASIPEMVNEWKSLPFRVDHVVLPHDAKVTELGSGKTRQEVFHTMGAATSLAPSLGLHEGISQLRDILPHAWFDKTEAMMLVEALLAYRSEVVEVKGIAKKLPEHSWASHWADSARYYAIGRPAQVGGWGDNSALYERLARGVI